MRIIIITNKNFNSFFINKHITFIYSSITSLVVSTCLEPSSMTLIIFVIFFLRPFSITIFSVLLIEATPGGNSSSPSSASGSFLWGLLYLFSSGSSLLFT